MTRLLEEAYTESLNLLKRAVIEGGFTASLENTANYRRVWSRDGVIAGLAALGSNDNGLIGVFAQTLDTLSKHQDRTGRIASNVSLADDQVSFGTTVGRVDATLWFVIGVCQYYLRVGDDDMLARYRSYVLKALFYLECLELNGRGLLFIPQGGDWADEYINHGYVLYDQILYYIALSNSYQVFNDPDLKDRADRVKALIRVNYFPQVENVSSPWVYNQTLFKLCLKDYRPPLPLTYFTAFSAGYHTDNFANSLLLLTDILDDSDKGLIKQEVWSRFSELPIIPAFDPVIEKGDRYYDDLERHYIFEFRNRPYEFHNGGLWPLIHGFFLASDQGNGERERRLTDLASFLAADDFLFPEFYHGRSFKPGGIPEHSFSASGYALAYQAIKLDRPPIVI